MAFFFLIYALEMLEAEVNKLNIITEIFTVIRFIIFLWQNQPTLINYFFRMHNTVDADIWLSRLTVKDEVYS